jgi:hypothetical protein
MGLGESKVTDTRSAEQLGSSYSIADSRRS